MGSENVVLVPQIHPILQTPSYLLNIKSKVLRSTLAKYILENSADYVLTRINFDNGCGTEWHNYSSFGKI